jgi:Rieske Fe-S protein
MTTLEDLPAGGPTRRTVLTSVGLAGVGVTALAGCGAGGTASDAASSAKDAATGAVKDAISKATIPVGGGKIFADQKAVVTQPPSREVQAFSAVCTHQMCILAEVSDGVIKCSSCHHSEFDITTGAVKKGPATKALPEKSISVSGDGITVT